MVRDVTDHGERVYTVDLEPSMAVPRFTPGQFLHLALDPYEPDGFWPESRVFSIASSPEERDRLSITYAVKGAFTTRMERELAPAAAPGSSCRTASSWWSRLGTRCCSRAGPGSPRSPPSCSR